MAHKSLAITAEKLAAFQAIAYGEKYNDEVIVELMKILASKYSADGWEYVRRAVDAAKLPCDMSDDRANPESIGIRRDESVEWLIWLKEVTQLLVGPAKPTNPKIAARCIRRLVMFCERCFLAKMAGSYVTSWDTVKQALDKVDPQPVSGRETAVVTLVPIKEEPPFSIADRDGSTYRPFAIKEDTVNLVSDDDDEDEVSPFYSTEQLHRLVPVKEPSPESDDDDTENEQETHKRPRDDSPVIRGFAEHVASKSPEAKAAPPPRGETKHKHKRARDISEKPTLKSLLEKKTTRPLSPQPQPAVKHTRDVIVLPTDPFAL